MVPLIQYLEAFCFFRMTLIPFPTLFFIYFKVLFKFNILISALIDFNFVSVDQDELDKKRTGAIEFGLKHASASVLKLKRDLHSKNSENVSLKRCTRGTIILTQTFI
jgi:hypothetical protein